RGDLLKLDEVVRRARRTAVQNTLAKGPGKKKTREAGLLLGDRPRLWLRAARVSPAVPTRVAAAGPHHPPAALRALLGVLECVEERGLPGRRRFHRHRRRCRCVAAVAIALRQTSSH